MATFDFKGYLLELDPFQSYTVIPLTGGRVNITARAIKSCTSHASGGRFPFHQSIVLKYAPPHIAMLGDGAPFSQFRQTIEARALNLFNPNTGELFPLCRLWSTEVPELLYHDPKAHVLILADLGELNTLTSLVNDMALLVGKSSKGQQRCSELGNRLGGFFADLHSSNTFKMLGHKRIGYFDNPGIKCMIYDNFVMPVRRRLHDFNIQEAEELFSRISSDFLRPDEVWEQSMILGDLWTGSILVDWPRVCVIDWEFAGIGRGVNGDITTLLAQLHLQLLASIDSSAQVELRAMVDNVVEAYRRQRLARWEGNNVEAASSIKGSVPASSLSESMSLIRSAFLLHGRKMVNNAIERDWSCRCCNGVEKSKRDCQLIAKLVDKGVWYLRKAAACLNDFKEYNNWTEVKREEGRVIIGLFLEPESETST